MDPTPATDTARVQPVAFTNGLLTEAGEAGRVYLWDQGEEGMRLLVIGRRQLVADAVFHVMADKSGAFQPFRPGQGLADGDPLDIVFASTEPLKATTLLTIDVRSDGKRVRFGFYNVQKQTLIPKPVKSWTFTAGFPMPLARAEDAEREREARALLDNFKALKNNWPQLRAPTVATEKNLSAPVPDLAHRQRIGGKVAPGDVDGSRFLSYGYEQAKSLLSIAEVYGCRLGAETTVMDWGVGCGRVARHIPPPLQPGFVGIDVDPVNIEWCQQNLPFGQYKTVEPYARTVFDDKQFDLIYSLSVLTHLSEPDQFHWLQELSRISRGLMILSVSGLYGTQTTKWSQTPSRLWKHLLHGFTLTEKALPELVDVTPEGYYRSTSHTPAYIYANWPRYIEVLDIIPAGVGSKQDAVICRPLKSLP